MNQSQIEYEIKYGGNKTLKMSSTAYQLCLVCNTWHDDIFLTGKHILLQEAIKAYWYAGEVANYGIPYYILLKNDRPNMDSSKKIMIWIPICELGDF